MITDKMLAQAAAELATAINESLPDPIVITRIILATLRNVR